MEKSYGGVKIYLKGHFQGQKSKNIRWQKIKKTGQKIRWQKIKKTGQKILNIFYESYGRSS